MSDIKLFVTYNSKNYFLKSFALGEKIVYNKCVKNLKGDKIYENRIYRKKLWYRC